MTWTFAVVAVALQLCALAGGSPKIDDNRDDEMDVFRLPGTTWPESYDLTLVPDRGGRAFSGSVRIVVVGGVATNARVAKTIALNLKDLNVTALSVKQIGGCGAAVTVTGWDCVPRNEQLVIRLKTAVVPGRRYLITVSYAGPIRDDQTGWHASAYVEDGVTKWMAVTQFEPTYARRAFPCYDEPAYKAVFNVSVVKLKNQTVLSNMPIREIERAGQNDIETVRFESTPLMPTYLLAFYVGQLVPNKNGSEITVYTHKDVVDQAEYAWNEAPKHFDAMKEYTGVSIPLTKLDLVAVPNDSLGAMENWGMNTFREQFLLLHDESKTVMKIHSSTVMQHEIVHNWFGNLVTCAWWDYAWLNEGFAQYFQFFATGMVRTTWPVEEWFVVESHQNSMRYDQSPKHPITASVNTPDEILDVFDVITYSKAASVIRMLKHLVTEEMFKLSLRKYLDTNKYNVTVPKDLFASFDRILLENNYIIGNELSVHEFMSNWTLQSGYPVLNVTKNETASTFLVTQSRFFINATVKPQDEFQAWHVGLTYTTELSKNFNYTQPSAWSNKVSNLTIIPAPSKSGWYIFNIQSTGYYRVNYDTNNWMALVKQLNEDHAAIHLLNRAQLIDDAFALARAGLLDYTVTLRLTKYLKKEDNVIPFYSAMNGFSYLMDQMRRNQEAYEQFEAYVGRLVGRMFKDLDILVSNGTTDFNVMCAWNSFSVWACCKLDYADCTMKAMEYFEKWRSGEKIPADIKDAAFCMGVKNSNGDSMFNKMFELFTKSTSISEQTSARLALACSTNRTQLTEYIYHIIFDGSKGPVTSKDYTSIINAISLTPLGLDVLYEFLSTNLKRILDEVHNGESIVMEIYFTLAHKMTDDNAIENLKCLKDNPALAPAVKSSFDYSFELMTNNLGWYETYSNTIGQWVIENEKEEEKEQQNMSAAPVVTAEPFPATPNTTVALEPSSSSTTLCPSFMISRITLFTVLVKMYIL